MYFQPVIAAQVLGRQRRPEILIAHLHPFQHRRAKLRGIGPIRSPPAVAVLQCLRASAPIPCPDPLALPIAHPQQLRRFAHPPPPPLHPSPHLPTPHPLPPH